MAKFFLESDRKNREAVQRQITFQDLLVILRIDETDGGCRKWLSRLIISHIDSKIISLQTDGQREGMLLVTRVSSVIRRNGIRTVREREHRHLHRILDIKSLVLRMEGDRRGGRKGVVGRMERHLPLPKIPAGQDDGFVPETDVHLGFREGTPDIVHGG